MALSAKERENIRKKDEIIDSLSNRKEDLVYPLNEASDNRFRSLRDIEDYIKGKKFFALKKNSFSYGSSYQVNNNDFDVRFSIFFLSNKNKTVSEDKNLITLVFRCNADNSQMTIYEGKQSTSLVEYLELPDGENYDERVPLDDIINMCDVIEIYDNYKRNALDIIQEYMPVAYQMFTGPNIIHRIDAGKNTTLYVGFNSRIGKFVYGYNPKFILRSVIEEYTSNPGKYSSLERCYSFLLAFYITHEMMHIITNNVSTDSGGMGLSGLEGADHDIENRVMDSFINCNLSILFKRVDGVKKENGLAPIPDFAVDSKISLRGEHNVGFKRFETLKELADVIAGMWVKSIGSDYSIYYGIKKDRDLTIYEGADVFFRVEVSPKSQTIRKSSMSYQKFINDVMHSITDGKIYRASDMFTDSEKVSDQDILPNGSFVRIKHTATVCVVTSYDSSTNPGLYTLNGTDITVTKTSQSDGTTLCKNTYTDNGSNLGQFNRSQIVPFDTEDESNSWLEGGKKERKDSITQEDINQLQKGSKGNNDNGGFGTEEKKPKILNIGDIVFCKSKGKFGRITAIHDGQFELEEMVEGTPRVIDEKEF
jgi:hypothetical protein